ncbi:MAG: S9 family peptidase, partial [Solirubrobacteraceae bacterium]
MRTIRAIVTLSLVAAPAAAQQLRQVTADDYARAERALPAGVAPLVSGIAGRPTWLADGRLGYRASVANGSAFFIVDPGRGTRTPAFDQTRLAAGLASASGGRVDANRLPFFGFELSKD